MTEDQPERITEADQRWLTAALKQFRGAQAALEFVHEHLRRQYLLAPEDLLAADGTIARGGAVPERLTAEAP